MIFLALGLGLFGCGNTAPRGNALVGAPAAYKTTLADYPALDTARKSDILVVSLGEARAAFMTATRPIWLTGAAADPEAIVPNIESAREVRREGEARVWIARSSGGGVCVLAFNPELSAMRRYHSVASSCDDAAELSKGTMVMQNSTEFTDRWVVSGVVPRYIGRVAIRLKNGATRVVRVADDAYVATVPDRVASIGLIRSEAR